MSLEIRPTESRDPGAVVEMYNHAVREEPTTLDTELKPVEQMVAWSYDHQQGRYGAFMGTIGNEVVGYAPRSPFAARGEYLASAELPTHVSPAAQGKQSGSQLTRFVADEAVRRGCATAAGILIANNDAYRRTLERVGDAWAGEWESIGVRNGVLIDMLTYQYRIPANESGYGRL